MGLNNQTLLILRAEDDIPRLVQQVRARGGVPVACPMIEIQPPGDLGQLDSAIKELSGFDWIVFTSANAAKFFIQRVSELGVDRKSIYKIQLAAIGPATEKALEGLGLNSLVVSSKANALEFLNEFSSQYDLNGQRVLLPLSNIALRTMPEGLAKRGAKVSEVVAYVNTAPDSIPEKAIALLKNNQIDWVLFSSPSTARHLYQLLNEENIEPVFRAASIGPSTSAALRELGVEPDVEADPHTFDGLLDEIGAHTHTTKKM